MSTLVVRDLYLSFGAQPVLVGVDLEVPSGGMTAVLGPSGSGKTTLLRVLAGFERADQGTVTVDGRVVEDAGRRHVSPEHRHIGYVPQEGALFPHLTVAANVGFGLPRRRRRARVAELLDMIELGSLAGRYPHELSGGQQQRVALARALAPEPGIVLLDEPFSSLDAALRSSVRRDVARLLAEAGTTSVLVTHDQDEALSVASQVAVMREGRFVQCGPPLEVYSRPADLDVARFVGEANLLEGQASGDVARTVLGPLLLRDPLEVPGSWSVTVLVRPEQIELRRGQDGPGAPGRVVDLAFHGHDVVVGIGLTVDDGRSPIVARTLSGLDLEVGAPVTLSVHGSVGGWVAGPTPAVAERCEAGRGQGRLQP